jgi:hypothetical protein
MTRSRARHKTTTATEDGQTMSNNVEMGLTGKNPRNCHFVAVALTAEAALSRVQL